VKASNEEALISALMRETEEAIEAAADDIGSELVECGGWIEIIRAVVQYSDASDYVKSEVYRMHGLDPHRRAGY
jgi:hypothetical protein